MNVNYINPFISASIEVVKTFAEIQCSPGRPTVEAKAVDFGDIKGFIGLNGHGITGYFIIGFPRAFLNNTLAHLFNSQTSAEDEELNDLAGELTNMISGSAKGELSKRGFFFDVAVPRISHDMPEIPKDLIDCPVIIVPFETPGGNFFIEAAIRTIEEDFKKDTSPVVEPPEGHISVETFAKLTRIAPVKIRRFLKTGFLSGKKISVRQWHIPESELNKIQGYRPPPAKKKQEITETEETHLVDLERFSQLSGLSKVKIKSFLRTGFLKGKKDETNNWLIDIEQVSRFR